MFLLIFVKIRSKTYKKVPTLRNGTLYKARFIRRVTIEPNKQESKYSTPDVLGSDSYRAKYIYIYTAFSEIVALRVTYVLFESKFVFNRHRRMIDTTNPPQISYSFLPDLKHV